MNFLKQQLKETFFEQLRKKGYRVERLSSQQWKTYDDYHQQADLICRQHRQQSQEAVAALRQKYQAPVLGKVRVWDLVERLGQCVDPGDRTLYCTSQFTHVLQMLAGMEKDGITDPDFYIAALVHDLGKVLLLTGEAPENVVGGHHKPIGEYEAGMGLDNCTLQWDHGEFAYRRFKDYLPDGISWLIRYHAILRKECEPFMDERDRAYTEKYLKPFYKYDCGTKSPYSLPQVDLAKYRDLIEQTFPQPIAF